jgi:uncharacterized Zn finger protein
MELPRNCPFCGANATQLKVVVKHQYSDAHGHAYVRCLNCNARGPLVKGERMSEVRQLALKRWEGNR